MTTITTQLKTIIKTCGISRYELSRQTGVTQAALSRFVNHERGLTLASVDRLAKYLGIELKHKGK